MRLADDKLSSCQPKAIKQLKMVIVDLLLCVKETIPSAVCPTDWLKLYFQPANIFSENSEIQITLIIPGNLFEQHILLRISHVAFMINLSMGFVERWYEKSHWSYEFGMVDTAMYGTVELSSNMYSCMVVARLWFKDALVVSQRYTIQCYMCKFILLCQIHWIAITASWQMTTKHGVNGSFGNGKHFFAIQNTHNPWLIS